MNLPQLRAFVAVVDEKSFSAAARCLGITQPAVTQQVQALEAALAATLFDRHYRRVDLTEQGRALLPFARRILSEIEEARNEIDRLSKEVTGRLTLVASTTPGQYVLPKLLGAFVAENPEVGLTLLVRDTSAAVEAVESGEADLGMTGAQVHGARVTFEEMGVDRLVMIAPPDSALAGREDLALADVVEQPFIMREVGSGTRMVFEETLKAAGIDPADLAVVTELGTSEAIVTAVEGGLGVGVVSSWMVEKALVLGTVIQVPVGHFPVERPFFAVLPKGSMSRAADAFLDFLREGL